MTKLFLILCFGGLLGTGASLIGIPLPWLIGPLVGTAAIALTGVEIKTPPQMRKLGQMTAAVAIGTTFTPDVINGLSSYIGIIIFCAAASILAAVVSASILARTGVGFETSFFASMPGGVAEMSVLAERYGGDTALVAVAQSMRIIIVVVTIPIALVLLSDDVGTGTPAPHTMDLWWPGLLLMLVLAAVLGAGLDAINLMNAYFLAGLAVGAFAILGPMEISSVPHSFVNVAQVLIGVALGARVDPRVLAQMHRFLPATVGGTVILIGFSAAPSYWVHLAPGMAVQTPTLATSPGGVAEMSITARALHLVAPLVTSFHLVRILMIVLMSAPVYRVCRRLAS